MGRMFLGNKGVETSKDQGGMYVYQCKGFEWGFVWTQQDLRHVELTWVLVLADFPIDFSFQINC